MTMLRWHEELRMQAASWIIGRKLWSRLRKDREYIATWLQHPWDKGASTMDELREVLVNRMRHLRQEITDIFSDQEHWNLTHSDENPIDVDADGFLARMAHGLDASLANEERIARGE